MDCRRWGVADELARLALIRVQHGMIAGHQVGLAKAHLEGQLTAAYVRFLDLPETPSQPTT